MPVLYANNLDILNMVCLFLIYAQNCVSKYKIKHALCVMAIWQS